MNIGCRRVIVGLLLAHSLIGIAAAWLGTFGPWTGIYVFAFMGLVCGQVLLLGSWTGLTSQPLGIRAAGLVCGSSFVTGVVAIGANLPDRTEDFLILACLIFVTAAMVSVLFISIRWYRNIAVERFSAIQDRPSTQFRFAVKHLLSATTLLSLLLGFGQVIRSLGGESLGIGVLLTVFVVCGCIMAWLVVWASLGQGRTSRRIPIVLALGCVIGLLPPYFLGGPSLRFLTWPGLMVATGTIAILSLLIVRSCGYRLVYNDAPN